MIWVDIEGGITGRGWEYFLKGIPCPSVHLPFLKHILYIYIYSLERRFVPLCQLVTESSSPFPFCELICSIDAPCRLSFLSRRKCWTSFASWVENRVESRRFDSINEMHRQRAKRNARLRLVATRTRAPARRPDPFYFRIRTRRARVLI